MERIIVGWYGLALAVQQHAEPQKDQNYFTDWLSDSYRFQMLLFCRLPDVCNLVGLLLCLGPLMSILTEHSHGRFYGYLCLVLGILIQLPQTEMVVLAAIKADKKCKGSVKVNPTIQNIDTFRCQSGMLQARQSLAL